VKLLLVLLVACTPHIVYRDVVQPPIVQRVSCVTWPPPSSPRDHGVCADMTAEECRQLLNARWSDYGHEAAIWFANSWPACAGG